MRPQTDRRSCLSPERWRDEVRIRCGIENSPERETSHRRSDVRARSIQTVPLHLDQSENQRQTVPSRLRLCFPERRKDFHWGSGRAPDRAARHFRFPSISSVRVLFSVPLYELRNPYLYRSRRPEIQHFPSFGNIGAGTVHVPWNGGAKIDGRPALKRLLDFADHREQINRLALAQIKDIER